MKLNVLDLCEHNLVRNGCPLHRKSNRKNYWETPGTQGYNARVEINRKNRLFKQKQSRRDQIEKRMGGWKRHRTTTGGRIDLARVRGGIDRGRSKWWAFKYWYRRTLRAFVTWLTSPWSKENTSDK